MCIIAAKPANTKLPSEEIRHAMWVANPHGAGVMYAYGGNVHIRKGFMTEAAFEQALTEIPGGEKTPIVLHYRIATHGGVNAQNTHPFPVSEVQSQMGRLKMTCPLAIAHNGIIRSVQPRAGLSDTAEYVLTQLAPLTRAMPTWYENDDLCSMVLNAIQSKMAVLNAHGDIRLIGDFTCDDGIFYSNSSYIPRRTYAYIRNEPVRTAPARKSRKSPKPRSRATWAELLADIYATESDDSTDMYERC